MGHAFPWWQRFDSDGMKITLPLAAHLVAVKKWFLTLLLDEIRCQYALWIVLFVVCAVHCTNDE